MSIYPALPIFTLAASALLLKATCLSSAQVITRLRSRRFLIPEDAQFSRTNPVDSEHPFVVRCGWVWRNDAENLPFFLTVSLMFTLLGGDAVTATWLFGGYVGVRYLHTIVYLRGLQPWRAVLFLVGLGLCWIIVVKSLILAYG